jgi:cytochrome P450
MSEEDGEDWSPLDAAVLDDQRRAYDEMRERCPVARSEFMGWSLFRHEDIAAVLADPGTYSNASQFLAIPNGMDPPAHGRHRDALDPNFEPKPMADLEPSVRELAADLLGPLLSAEEVEFIEAFANPFALRTLCAWLGWPEQHWKRLGGWVHGSQQAAFDKDPVAGKSLADSFSELVKSNLDERRAAHGNAANATDALLGTEIDGVRLDDDQIVSVLRNWTAGHGTVAAALGIVVLHLAQESELQDRLRSEPSLVPAAIEEILRVDGPLVANARTATRKVEFHGRSIPEGEHLMLMWIAANRDPRAFEDSDVVSIERNTADSMVWGQGIHLCQGAPLARLELRVAIEELLSNTTRIDLARGNVASRDVFPGNGLAKLPLRLS